MKKGKAEIIEYLFNTNNVLKVRLENGDERITTLSLRFLKYPFLFKKGKIITVIRSPYDKERVHVDRDSLLFSNSDS